MIHTKIVATLGPATSSVEILLRLFEEGVDVCRLNFSHGDLEAHGKMLQCVREAARKCGQPIAVLGDLGGPKIRLGAVRDQDGTGGMPIDVGQTLIIQRQPIEGADLRVSTTYPKFVDEVRVGDRVLVEDGMLRFLVTGKLADELTLACTVGGVLKTAKGINLPDTPLNVSAITEKDWPCADWAIENGLDYLALSFVRRADELRELRRHLDGRKSSLQLVAKIEKPEALKHIDAIIAAADALMVARGDLGVEMDVAQVPIIQKDLVRRCQSAGKPVIVATQMLQSMIEQASPTRAEVSDVANAIFDGADAVMLSGETSVGKYPVPTVHMMNHIAEVTEDYLHTAVQDPAPLKLSPLPISAAVARGVWNIAREMPVKLVAIWSQTGTTARIFSRHRFCAPLLAFSSDDRALRRMKLYYGVEPHEMAAPKTMGELIERIDRLATERKLAGNGDRIIIVAGSSLGTPGTMNSVVVHTVGQEWKVTRGF